MASLGPSPSIRNRPFRARRAVGALLAAVMAAGVLSACVGEPPEVAAGDAELVAGRAVYGASCASCHGSSGNGGVGPRLSGGSAAANFPDVEDQIALVTNGRDRMPAFVGRLTEDEIRAVVRYSREVL